MPEPITPAEPHRYAVGDEVAVRARIEQPGGNTYGGLPVAVREESGGDWRVYPSPADVLPWPEVERTQALEAGIRQVIEILGPTVPSEIECEGCKAEWAQALALLAGLLPKDT